MIEATTSSYWIASDALYISLNANDDPDYIMGNAAANSYILCYIKDIDGLDYDAGHNYRRWPLSLSPTYFSTPSEKYVYVAIPRPNTINTQAVVVFPSEKLDIYGKNINEEQVGSEEYYYIWLQGIITATNAGHTLNREWNSEHHINTGTLSSDEAIAASSEQPWFRYSSVDDTVTFLKKILMDARSSFLNLILGNKNLTGVATSETEYTDSDTLVATPSYISSQYLSKTNDDTAEGNITFKKGVRVVGSSGGTTPDTDNVTQKNLGLEVSESGVIGGILRVAQSLLTKTIQSLNFSGSDSLTGTGWQLTDDYGTGRSRLIVDDAVFRGKVTMNELEVRKLTAMGGNYVFSPAASIIEQVDYYDVDGRLMGYTRIKVPWVLRLIPLSLFGRYLSRYKWVRSTITAEDLAQVKFYRCWLKADDGSTQTINTWRAGMLARCQTFDTSQVENGTHDGTYSDADVSWGKNVTNKLYWRAVVAVADGIDKEEYERMYHQQTIALDDGRKHNFIDIANYTDDGVQLFLTGSDHVSAGDHIVCFGDWLDRQLANLVTIETIGSDAPAVKEFVGVGYTDGTSIDWNLDGKMRTRISPTAGNRFIAPEFIIETDGEFVKYDECVGFDTPSNPKDGDVMLLSYDDIANDYQVEVWDADTSTWNDEHDEVGQRYYCTANGHVYEATATGWKDLGIQLGQSVSSLKVGMDGIVTQVSNLNGNLSTLSQTVGGIETRVQNAEGNITTLNQTATGLTAEVTSIKQGKNLLSGVLTGQGWTDDTNADAACDAANVSIKTAGEGATALITPQVMLPKGSKYTLSFDVAAVVVTVQWSDGTAIGTATGTGRKTLVIDLTQAAADVTGKIKIFVTELSYPMLEIGEVATEFVAGSEETSAFANISSHTIQLAVQHGLEQTGIYILQGIINLFADKVRFYKDKSAASSSDPAKIWIDGNDGSLHAVDGVFSGTITSENGRIGAFKIEQNELHAIVWGETGEYDEDGNPIEGWIDVDGGMYLYRKQILFNSDSEQDGRQAKMGTDNAEPTSNLPSRNLSYLLDTVQGIDGVDKVGTYYRIIGAERSQALQGGGNYAFLGYGDGLLHGMVDGFNYHKVELTRLKTNILLSFRWKSDYSAPTTISPTYGGANRFLVSSSYSGSYVVLPTLSDVAEFLHIPTTLPFAVHIYIVGHPLTAEEMYIYGRWNNIGTGDTNYPLLMDNNGNTMERYAFSRCDSYEFLLINEPDAQQEARRYFAIRTNVQQ